VQATVALRDAEPRDLPEVVRLCRAHALYERADPPAPGQARRLAALLFGPRPRLRCLVVADGERLVGYATWSLECSTWRAAEYAHLDCLYLEQELRGRGLGRALLERVAAGAAELGATYLEWQTPAWNAGAIRFYERLGAAGRDKKRFTWNAGAAPARA
jgi:GNAT superfamily N-acetyltransferase